MDKVAGLKQQVLEEFGEALKNPAELADAQETLAEVAEHVMDDMIIEDHDDIGTLDIRAMQLATTQFKLCAEKAKEESYMIPIQTGDSVTGVSLKIVRGEKKKGAVDILFESSAMGKVAASFEAKSNRVSGMIAVDDPQTAQTLREHLEAFTEAVKQGPDAAEESVDINVAYVEELSLAHYEMVNIRKANVSGASSQNEQTSGSKVNDSAMGDSKEVTETQTSSTAGYQVQTGRLYHIAESFIRSIQELTN